jgi:hypothetical protein
LFAEAERRRLAYRIAESNVIEVSSATRAGLWHQVQLIGDEVRCTCEATEACTHQALACSYWFPVTCLWKWTQEEADEFAGLRRRIQTNELTTSEKRRVNRSMRAVRERLARAEESEEASHVF